MACEDHSTARPWSPRRTFYPFNWGAIATSIFARQQDRFIYDVKADFVERKIGEPDRLRGHEFVVAVFADQLGRMVLLDSEFPYLKRWFR
jgi:hypothetical protein